MTPAETPIERCPSMRRTRGVASLVRLAVAWWIVVLSVVSGPGCQSDFTIKVEKLRGVSGRWDNGADGALSSVYDVLTQLDRLCSECRATYGDEAVSKLVCPLPQTQQEIRDLLALSETLSQRRMKGEIGGHAFIAQVDALRRRVMELMPEIPAETLQSFVAAQTDGSRQYAMADLARRLPQELDHHASRLRALRTVSAGFGGFNQAGVYRINPGDPMYDAVLDAAASSEPLTCVTVCASGDASAMIVQESPGQMRLYQISNDPVSLMRNTSLILDKVLQAAVQFQTVGSL